MKLNWSRRELEAFGEPLGDCVTTPKLGGGWICGGGGKGGGGGGPQQVTSTTTSSNVPEYARPYVENMLSSAQSQIYNDNMTGFRPYQPYSTDPSNYFAGFSPLQQSAQQGAYNLTTPGEFGAGSALTTVGGVGALGTAANMANAGQNYQNQATSMYGPGGVGAYMNPYLAQSLAPQLQQLNQQFGIKGAQEQAAATSAGAFGGSRNALMQGLNQQNRQMAAQQAISQGYDKAFQQAQQAQQFGANLGLQGQQGALQGLGQVINAGQGLGQLGSQRLAADQGILNTQSAMGAQQQQLEQNKINQSIQDYATAQQYPFMQLGMMNSMLRGLPMQNMSTQQYQATPSYLTQGLGAVGTLAGAYKAFGQKEGGIVGMKEGGAVPSYAGPQGSVVESVRAKLEELASQPGGVEKVKQIAQTSPSDEVRKMAAVVVAEHTMQAQAEQQVAPVPQAQSQGIAALPAPSMDGMAGGGIIAFAGPDGSEVEDPDLEYLNLAEKQRNMALQRAGIMNPANSKMKEFLAKQVGALPGVKESEKGLMMMDYFSNLGSQTGPLPYAALKAAKETTPTFRKGLESIKKAEADVIKSQNELEQADRLDALGLNREASALRKDAEANKRALDIARMQTDAQLKAAGMNATREDLTDKSTKIFLEEAIAKLPPDQREAARKNPTFIAEARRKALEMGPGMPGRKLDVQEETAADRAVKDSKELKILRRNQAQYDPGTPEHGKLQEEIKAEEDRIRGRYNKGNAPATPAPVPAPAAPKAPNISTVEGAPPGATIGAFVAGRGFEIKDKSGKVVGYAQQ
jgi:hypothetical protein